MRLRFNRIGIIFALLITVGAISVSASNAHHCLIGEPITTWKTTDNWSKNYEEFALTSPANTKWDEFCIYMWVETNQTFAFNNQFFNPGEAKQVGPSSDQATINKDGGTGVGVATDGTTNAWKYTGATGLVKICAAQSSGGSGQGEWKPYVWVEESKEIEILKGNKIMFYFGMTTSWNENWNVLRTSNTSEKTADQQYHRLPESKCSSWISVAYVSPAQYYVGKTEWAGVQMESTAEAGCLYSVYNDGSDKIYKNVSVGAIPHFTTTTVNKTVGAVDSEIAATVTNSIYGNEQVLYYYYTTDGGTTFTKFDPSDISSLAVGVYTIYALGWDGHILVRSDNTVTLNVGVTISLDANGGTDGDVTSVFATSGIAASTGNIAAASLPTKTGYTFNGFWTSGGIEVINENGEWKTDVSGYTDNSGNWICSAASTLYAHWTPKPYIVTLEGMEADSDDPIMVNVTYDAVLPSLETKHTKAHYDLLGYWAANDDHGMNKTEQLIDANGDWIPDIAGYTGNDGEGHPTWIRDGINISLFADWTEHPYTVTTSVSPAGAGTLSCGSSVTAKWVTPSEPITANANIGYSFIEWDFSKTGEDNDVYSAEGYTSTSNPIRIKARHDGTLTAKFTANNYNVNLENLDADEKGTENISVTYNSSVNLTENITIPQKAHYDFGGYYTSSDEGVTLDVPLIDENGAWIVSVDGYTDSDKNWLYADNLTLYAKWTEHPYTIDLVVSPEGAGTIKIGEDVVGSVNAFISTPTDWITATPANPAWKFKGWQYSENVGPADGTGNDNTVQIKATRNGTLTAVFEPRYALVGQLWDGTEEAGGMPGMNDYTVDFEVKSYNGLGEAGVDLQCTRTLQPNAFYGFQIRDRVAGENYGKNSGEDNPTLGSDERWILNDQGWVVLFNTSAVGPYTFKITNITEDNGAYYPTVEIVYPTAHQLELGWRYTLIDTPDELKEGDTGGTVTATSSGFSIKDKEYIADGEELQLTANAKTGYSFDNKWYDNNDCQNSFMSGNPTQATVTSHFRVYAKFAEIPTPITITKIGGGEVQINGEDKESTSVGVTTTRTLTAVAAAGYTFSGWTLPENADFEMIEGDVDNPTIKLRGKGAGIEGEIIANFTECWVLSAESDGWGSAEFTIANITVEDGKAIGYADIALPANTNLQFKVVDKSTSIEYKNGVDKVYYMTYGNSKDWIFGMDKTYNCGITTAGKGSYRFNWNFTDKTMTVVYPESYQVNYGAAVGGSVTSVLDDDGKEIPNGGYVRKGGSVTYEATASDGYTFTGWCPNDSYGDTFTDINPWENSDITATSNAYAKFHSTNFVIYRTGDKESDPRAVWDDVKSYDGGTISETIEFRMKVNELDYWYTLCLPFTVTAVKVWDEEDGRQYYDIVPYWRTKGTYYTGHYILRRPVTTTNFAIEGFEGKDRWIDPESSDVLPSKNIPYIIQWHDEYFQGKYISFFGTAGQTIPTAMDKGSYASSDETVNIYGNNSMTTGTVHDAYLLEPDYGPNGAWIREDIGTERSVLPFECFILANSTTTAKYRVLRRDMADDTPTGLDTLSLTEDSVLKVMINNRIYIIRGGKIYTIQGTFVKEVE